MGAVQDLLHDAVAMLILIRQRQEDVEPMRLERKKAFRTSLLLHIYQSIYISIRIKSQQSQVAEKPGTDSLFRPGGLAPVRTVAVAEKVSVPGFSATCLARDGVAGRPVYSSSQRGAIWSFSSAVIIQSRIAPRKSCTIDC